MLHGAAPALIDAIAWQRRRIATTVVLIATLVAAASLTVSPVAAAEPLSQLGANVAPGLAHSERVAGLDASQQVDVQLALNLRDQEGVKDLIKSVSTPGSPDYGHYLTSQQFGDRFGPTQQQVNAAVTFLKSSGLTVTSARPGSTLVNATGTAAQVSSAMHTSMSRYRDQTDGRDFYANDSAPSLPSSIASIVQGVHGLDNHALRHSSAVPKACCAGTPYTPTQIRTGYNFTSAPLAGLTGSGQTMGLLELNQFHQSDVSQFDTTYSLTPPAPQVLAVPGGSVPFTNGGAVEVELDIEVMQGIAPAANIMVFEAPNTNIGVNNGYGCMADSNYLGTLGCPNYVSGATAPANSTSWGLCEHDQGASETATLNSIFQTAAATGHSFYAASGDTGTNDGCSVTPAVDSPASDPNVTGTGGTKLLLDASTNAWTAESAWPAEPRPNLGGGGGLSSVFTRPSYQVGPGVLNGFSNGNRQVPDVSLNSDPVTGFSIYTCSTSTGPPPACAPSFGGIGGTSAAAPAWAAFTAIYNQYAASQVKPNLGFANPALYAASSCPQSSQPFHDIVQGSNPNNAPFSVTSGWDFLTGLGSFNAAQLASVAANVGSAPLSIQSVSPGQSSPSGGIQVTLAGCGFKKSGNIQPTVSFGGSLAGGVNVVSGSVLTAIVPARSQGVVAVTVTNPAGAGGASATQPSAFTYTQVTVPPPGGTNLYALDLNNNGSNTVEVHGLSQQSDYSAFFVHAASAFGASSASEWQFMVAPSNGDGQPDLYGIHLNNTGSGTVEVHALSAASNYQSFIVHAATPLGPVSSSQVQFSLAGLASDGRSNLYAVFLNGTGSGTVEVHALSEASNFSAWALHSASAFGAVSAANWQFRITDRFGSGDLVGIAHAATGSGVTEVHALARTSGYQGFTIHAATPLGLTNDSQVAYAVGDHDADGYPDVYAIFMNGTGSGQTEIHVLSGRANYTGWNEHASTAFAPTNTSSWQFAVH